jgi:uncharacterized repeat protein (TIGR03803 family)
MIRLPSAEQLTIFLRFFIACSAVAFSVSGCGLQGVTNSVAQTAAHSVDAKSSYRLLYAFKGGADGSQPEADLTAVDGKLYGTASSAGDENCFSGFGCGTVFQMTLSGAYRVLHRFVGSDGADPAAGLLEFKGNLYGTTADGGSEGQGTVYRITTSGQERALYSFLYYDGDGRTPTSELVADNGVLYGTTRYGGRGGCYSSSSCGTVFALTLAGKEKILYKFASSFPPKDGVEPWAGLTLVGGEFYGATIFGGTAGAGTIYSVTSTGKEAVRYSFPARHNGMYPETQLIELNGELYGVTTIGGAYGLGMIYAVSPSGKERILHAFKGSPDDGAYPASRLTAVNGVLYGTTRWGGTHQCSSKGTACGTVFSVTPTGKESVLYSFAGGKDGAIPEAGLVYVNGTLYGTTYGGGGGKCGATSASPGGCGTIFSIAP